MKQVLIMAYMLASVYTLQLQATTIEEFQDNIELYKKNQSQEPQLVESYLDLPDKDKPTALALLEAYKITIECINGTQLDKQSLIEANIDESDDAALAQRLQEQEFSQASINHTATTTTTTTKSTSPEILYNSTTEISSDKAADELESLKNGTLSIAQSQVDQLEAEIQLLQTQNPEININDTKINQRILGLKRVIAHKTRIKEQLIAEIDKTKNNYEQLNQAKMKSNQPNNFLKGQCNSLRSQIEYVDNDIKAKNAIIENLKLRLEALKGKK